MSESQPVVPRQEKLYRPLLQIAVLCEKVLREADGVVSVIRIVDRVNVTGDTPEMPPTNIRLTLLIGFKSGFMRGKLMVKITPITPSAAEMPALVFPLLLEGDDRGAAVIGDTNLLVKEEGLYWFDVAIEDELITRVPLRVVYLRVRFETRPQGG